MEAAYCPACQSALVENALFCSRCAAPVKCRACGRRLPSGAAFCSDCGSPVRHDSGTAKKGGPRGALKPIGISAAVVAAGIIAWAGITQVRPLGKGPFDGGWLSTGTPGSLGGTYHYLSLIQSGSQVSGEDLLSVTIQNRIGTLSNPVGGSVNGDSLAFTGEEKGNIGDIEGGRLVMRSTPLSTAQQAPEVFSPISADQYTQLISPFVEDPTLLPCIQQIALTWKPPAGGHC
ncbi:MAG: zinc ribbon domain-containing protein [Chloroflexota bacterium]